MPTADLAPQIPYVESHHQSERKTGELHPTGISPVQSDKHIIHGLEVVQQLVWQGWEAGSEYTKNIVVKNVSSKSHKLHFSSPQTRFFSTLYPKPVMLSPGTSFCLPVTFRPLEKIKYKDKIHFQTKEGIIEVPLLAVLPVAAVAVPACLDFQMCAAHDVATVTFKVINTGDVDTMVQWETTGPFTIEPTEAFVKYRSCCQFTATFHPEAATVYELEAVCHFGPDRMQTVTTTLKGIGKYPHLLVSLTGRPASSLSHQNLEAVVHFGAIPVGSTATKWVELHNLSPVQTPFQVEHAGGLNPMDRVFNAPYSYGIVPALSIIRIPITFSPSSLNSTSTDYFNVTAVGNISRSLIKCVGSSKGPMVHLSTTSINFNQIDEGQTATRTIDVVNTSDIDAVYQFMLDNSESVFQVQQLSGEIKAHSHVTLCLTFNPVHPISYLRRVTCLIHNQGPLYLDLLGTCHSELTKPAVLLSRHVCHYRTHALRGFTFYPPEQLNQMLQEKKLKLDENGCITAPQAENQPSFGDLPPFEEYFNDGIHSEVTSSVPHVSADISYVNFGKCQNIRAMEEKTINITNHTHGKVLVQWNTRPDHVFTIVQTTTEIPPLKACSFRIKFQPNAPNQLYGAELECFVYYKSMRDYRLVQDATHCPPWCLTFTCTGHTFQPNNETFLPWYQMDPSSVVFSGVSAKEAAYRTILLTNTASTPIMYNIQNHPNNIFAVKPFQGVLQGKHQIFVVCATPEKVNTYRHNMVFQFNDNEKYDQDIDITEFSQHHMTVQLWASADCPEVLLESEGCLFFKPTCIGTSSHRTYTIKNTSRIPLRFEWHMKHSDAKQLKVHPDAGIIFPNESQSQVWTFIPSDVGKFVMKPSLVMWGQGFSSNTSGGKKREFPVRIIGEGAYGSLEVDQTYFDFGDLIVGSSSSKSVTLLNNSSCSVIYHLSINSSVDENDFREGRPGLELEPMQGIIPARSKQVITATVRPVSRTTYQYAVSYRLLEPEAGHRSGHTTNEQHHLFYVLTSGVYPSLVVTDARCSGSLVGISKKQLWALFSLDSLNEALDANPSAEEVMYNIATRHSFRRRPPVYTRSIFEFNFSAAPLGSHPGIVTLMFENSGTLDTDWAFLLPSDLQLELEYWAETGEFDEDELHEMKVMDNKLFEITPQKGRLPPGATQVVTFTYNHTMAGTDRLPVLFKLSCGREILLNFIGMTVDHLRHYIHFPSNKHMFTPVPIGEKVSPKQVYELYNGGAVPVRYEFDLTPLDIIQKENYDQVIFECLNPIGEILPGRTMSVEWRFSPLEAKTYMVDIPIYVHHGDMAVVTFTGVGYDRRIMGHTMPVTEHQDLSGVPSVQSATMPGQLAQLSSERVSFGNMPLFTEGRRIIFIINTSKTRAISFQWHVTSPADSQLITILPVQGSVPPNGECLCRITFLAARTTSFYDIDLICEITDEHEVVLYNKNLQAWMAELERQQQEFTITEFDLDADKRMPFNPDMMERPPSGRLAILEGARKLHPEGELTRYKTLPPIQHPSADEERETCKALESMNKNLWAKPLPPRPFIMHLGLTARTHDILNFQENFPLDYGNFYINRTLGDPLRTDGEACLQVKSIECQLSESAIITNVLANILRGLLDDKVFTQSVKKVMVEPVPYFAQYSGRCIKSAHSTQPEQPGSSDHRDSTEGADTSCISSLEQNLAATSLSSANGEASEDTAVALPSLISSRSVSSGEQQQLYEAVSKQQEAQTLKKLPEFGRVIERILENTVLNIVNEALAGEYNITARRRYIASQAVLHLPTLSPLNSNPA
ncbi:cilia- and flagella-associated protein 65-like isoform X2 [Pomacea canaliculata]|uniref:cilia- and flagella-associated protein 65-like isoform X2 n=1 Tax=Pomacea canaliculata TaxID=400727 RepID=UPI000D734A0E|nr:cilia- and flagella-associated protein 65-like isoform X2 [Pomacea canaliculata]